MSVILDVAVCFLWLLTYILVLIGTIHHRYPLISPISQLFFGTNEFAVLLFFIGNASRFHQYVIITYIFWALIEIAIFIAIIRTGAVKKSYIVPYIALVVILSIFLYCLIAQKDCMTFICYFNAFCGVLFWLRYFARSEYPCDWIALSAFVSKLLADLLAIPVNMGNGGSVTGLISLLLPMLDAVFIYVFFSRSKQKKAKERNNGILE